MKFTTKNILIIITLTLIFLSFLYLALFVFVRPLGGIIVEDRPILQTLCNMQAQCHVGAGHLRCSLYEGKLDKYYWFKGCNNSTRYYSENERGIGYVDGLQVCSCGGLM